MAREGKTQDEFYNPVTLNGAINLNRTINNFEDKNLQKVYLKIYLAKKFQMKCL